MRPIRVYVTFGMVLPAKIPSSVTGHLTVLPSGSSKVKLVHVTLKLSLVEDRFLADALAVSAAIITTAAVRPSARRVSFDMGTPSDGCNDGLESVPEGPAKSGWPGWVIPLLYWLQAGWAILG
jgi:hypothetical protein